MWRIFLLGLVVLASPFAQAELERDPDTDIFYKFGAGARFRQYYFNHATAGAEPTGENFVRSSHRAQIDLMIRKGEFFKTYFRAIHQGTWGANAVDQNNFLIQQAWGDWKVSEFLNLRFGREAIQVGRGLVYGYNEWENAPTYYDGFSTIFDWDVLDFSIHALKLYQLDKVTNVSTASDPDVTNFILDVNLKQISDYIRMANFNFAQIHSDIGQIPNTTTILNKQSIQRFGFDLVTDGVNFRTGATLNYVTGTEITPAKSMTVKQFLVDGEARYMQPDWYRLNAWFGAHYDSGDKDASDNVNEQYEPLNYNFHINAGRLDLLKFGNLTFFRSGFSMAFFGDWDLGIEAFVFRKTVSNGATNFFRTPMATQFSAGTYQLGADKQLGTELDLWITRTFSSGVNLDITLNYFNPGQAFHKATNTATSASLLMDKSIVNLIVDVGFFF
ncbi:MAG: alginate export family protein [Bdellovibrionaceae bacterium]|nr:alginate export family protein [Pseudobdellovibrionaceae bacterium]